MRFNDPTGMAPELADFEPTKEGHLRVEKGDTAEKLKQQYGVVVSDKNFKFKEGNVILLDNNMTRSIEKSNETDDYNVKTDCYNCHGAAIAALKGEEINPTTAGFKDLNDPFSSEVKDVNKNLKEVSSESAVHGKTILSFGDHSAVYYGTSNDGTEYYFSKNGATHKPAVFTLEQLKTFYPENAEPKLLNYEPNKKQ